MEAGFFETVRDAFEGFVAGVGGRRHVFVHSRGLKVWYDDVTREHYESELIRVDGEQVLEIGFHAEYPKAPLNEALVQRLLTRERVWRSVLGDDAIAGDFIGRRGGNGSPRSGHDRTSTPLTSSTRRSRPRRASPTT